MKENDLANIYLKTINKSLGIQSIMSQNEIWELATKLAKMAQPRKSYQKLYNSAEGRMERIKLSKQS